MRYLMGRIKRKTNSFQIEKNVPIPGHRGKYPFADMEPGDSMVGSVELYTAMRNWAQRRGMRVVRRQQGDDSYRIWLMSND